MTISAATTETKARNSIPRSSIPRNSIDDIIDIYKRDVDVTLIDECLSRTVEQRLQALQDMMNAVEELRAGVRAAK